MTLEDVVRGNDILKDWNWQPIFISLMLCGANERNLELLVLTSTGERGSDAQFEEFKELTGKLVSKVKVRPEHGVDAYNADDIRQHMENALQRLKKVGVEDKTVAIDITGGTATVSAVGTLYALQKDRRIIYSGYKDEQGNPRPLVVETDVSFLEDMKI